MGATASKSTSDTDSSISGQEKMQHVSRTLLNKIENPVAASTTDEEKKANRDSHDKGPKVPSLPRQQFMDSSIQGKIREELSRLRKQEADVQKQIESALEKESLDRASQSASSGAKGKSSIVLAQELEDVRSKIERHNQRRATVDKAPGVQQARNKVIECYSSRPNQTLECWAEVRDFRQAVARAESDFVATLST